MFLSLLRLNPSFAAVQKDIRDVGAMHCRVMQAFPDVLDPTSKARLYFGVLHRLEYSRAGGWMLYVQSKARPAWDCLPKGYLSEEEGLPAVSVKSVAAAYNNLRVGQLLRFRLKANVTKKVDTKTGPDGQKRNGKRVPLQHGEDQVDWLIRIAERHGFDLQQVVIAAGGSSERAHSHVGNKTFQGVLFEGVLRVHDPALFREAVESGIGPAKAYGFGLLSVAPR